MTQNMFTNTRTSFTTKSSKLVIAKLQT